MCPEIPIQDKRCPDYGKKGHNLGTCTSITKYDLSEKQGGEGTKVHVIYISEAVAEGTASNRSDIREINVILETCGTTDQLLAV